MRYSAYSYVLYPHRMLAIAHLLGIQSVSVASIAVTHTAVTVALGMDLV